jgi:hypothetical protein
MLGSSYWQVGEGTVFGRYWGNKEGWLAFRPVASSAFLALSEAPAGSLPRTLIDSILPPPTPKAHSSNWLAVVYSVQEVFPSPQLRVLEKSVLQLGYNWVTGEWDEGIETVSLSYKWLGQDIFASSIAAIDLLLSAGSAPQPHKSEDPPVKGENRLERREGMWHIVYDGSEKSAPVELKGWTILARLLEKPHDAVHSLELEGHPPKCVPRSQTDPVILEKESIREYQAELTRIEDELKDAYTRAEAGSAEAETEVQNLEGQREKIASELRKAVAPQGRKKRLDEGNEAVKSVGRVKSALSDLKASMRGKWFMQALADHLDQCVGREGNAWVYRPDPPETRWHVQT